MRNRGTIGTSRIEDILSLVCAYSKWHFNNTLGVAASVGLASYVSALDSCVGSQNRQACLDFSKRPH